MGRNIGVDLRRDCFTTATLAENGRCYKRDWRLSDLGKFVATLAGDDKVAVEMTSNVRLFHEAVAPSVARVDVVNTRQFRVVTESVKKTDRNDAEALARFLAKDLLPTVHLKDKHLARIASLTRSRETLVKQRTTLKNKLNNLFAAGGVKLARERLSSNKALAEVERTAEERFEALEALEVRVFIRQIHSLNESISELESAIKSEGGQLKGFEGLTSIKGIGALSATIFLTVIGDVKRFPGEGQLAAYLGVVPRVSDSNATERRGRITKLGSKLARTTLVQCGLIAKKYSPFLANYHARLKRRKGGGKANIALARKLLGIIYRTLQNEWVFEDFASYRLKGGIVPLGNRKGDGKHVAARRDLSPAAKTGRKK